MFLIEKENNSIRKVPQRSFSELGFKERTHLQEWIAGNPEALGEKLLIIQKEFDQFSETYERLDLLAIDKAGNLVIIENKLDDSGRDVTWQALKYASYCSTLKKEQIRTIFQDYLDSSNLEVKAEALICEFLSEENFADVKLNQGLSQRIFLIAANFRKEVTSTVIWLMQFKLQVKCFKATPYELDGQHFLTLDQIIPTKDAQDFIISMNSKAQEEFVQEEDISQKQKIRLKFWTEFLAAIKGKSPLFQNSNPTRDSTLYAGGADIQYVSFTVSVTESNAFVTLTFGRFEKDENKILFDALAQYTTEVDSTFGEGLVWERKEDYKRSAVACYNQGLNYCNQEQWKEIISFLINAINKLERSVRPYLPSVKDALP